MHAQTPGTTGEVPVPNGKPTPGAVGTRSSGPIEERAPVAGRRVGYLVAAAINVVFWYGVNAWPTWAALPFLTPDFARVLGLVNAAILTSIVANLVYLVYDPRWVRAVGDLVAAAAALLALVALWQLFPFALDTSTIWPLVARTALAFGMAGCGISIIVQLVVLVRTALDPTGSELV
jgi:hypothetical protein